MARLYASAGTIAMVLCLCLSASLCLSQVGVLSEGMNGLRRFRHGDFSRPVLHCVLRKFRYLQKPSETFS